jgi:hypothetical protein
MSKLDLGNLGATPSVPDPVKQPVTAHAPHLARRYQIDTPWYPNHWKSASALHKEHPTRYEPVGLIESADK